MKIGAHEGERKWVVLMGASEASCDQRNEDYDGLITGFQPNNFK